MAGQIRQVIRWIIMIQFALVLIIILYGDLLLGLFGEQFIEGKGILSVLVLTVMLQTAFACNDLLSLQAQGSLRGIGQKCR